MHVRSKVIRYVECDDLSPCPFVKVVQLAGRDVVFVNEYVVVPVRSTLLVPEADGMSHFMSYRSVLMCQETVSFY